MAVKEYWEIKWIKWIAVQEDWTTVVSIADTVNIVWGWTVTDVWWVATINIPEWVIWYREDVPMWSATYTFLNSPATNTSFLVFTDSGTLMFLWIDYTYDPATETITFLSLWANEAAYVWVAHASVMGWGIGDMVKSVYDPTNINSSAFDYHNFINVPTKLSDFTNDWVFITAADIPPIPTKTSDLVNDSGFVTSAWDVYWPASSVDNNIAVFDWATWKIIKDSWLSIEVVNTIPNWVECRVYYDNGKIYLYTLPVDNLITENWDDLITEDNKNLILESN